MYDKLANIITKRYKLVIAIWVFLLIASVPAIMSVNDVVVYQETEMVTSDYESMEANDIITEQFQSSVANGSIMIVIQADNVTSAQMRDFVLRLQNDISSSTDIQYYLGTTTAYSVETMLLAEYIPQLGAGVAASQAEVNDTLSMLYGIPAMHTQLWVAANGSGLSPAQSDAQSYAQTLGAMQQMLAEQPVEMQLLAYGYFDAYIQAWNATGLDPSLVSNPALRTQTCISNVAPTFISGLPLPAEQVQFLQLIYSSFDLTTFSDQTAVHQFALGLVAQQAGITNLTFLESAYMLGPAYDQAQVLAFASSVVSSGTIYDYPVLMPAEVRTSFIAENNRTMLVMVSFSMADDYVTEDGDRPMEDNVVAIRDLISAIKADGYTDVKTYVTGGAALSKDLEESAWKDTAIIEPVTIIIILLLMGVLFRSVVAQFIPLGTAVVALGISQAMVFVVGSTIISVHYTVLTLLFAILMGVGVDYSIFIVTRYREERIKGATRPDAVHTSITWAGESITTSGMTVVISFFAMTISSFSMMQSMGLLLGLSIIIALLVALTLIPSLVMLFGNRIFWPTVGQRWENYRQKFLAKKASGQHGYFNNAAKFSVKHAKAILLAAVLVSIPTTYIYMSAETSFDFIGGMASSESTDGLDAMSEDFGAGKIMPTQVIITNVPVYDGTSYNMTTLDAIDRITQLLSYNSNVQEVSSTTRPYGDAIDYRNVSAMNPSDQALIMQGMAGTIGKDNSTIMLTVVLKTQPMDADSVGFIPEARDILAAAVANEPVFASSEVLVGGSTAIMYDLSENEQVEFNNMQIIVVIGIFIVLMLVLGSLLLPLFAIVSIAMSISWSFAATVLLFGNVLGDPILWMVPLILFIMLMGIGMDYNVFILTRIREEASKGKDNETAVVDAIEWTGGIITALALIMGGAFGSMMISQNAMLQEFGFALFMAIILDAMVVRTYIVPAAMTVMGKYAWWAPGRLQRVGREEKMKK